ncbi:MAG: flavin reductase family protein, partial [Deltaproteobacteria bacterium]|nr:flavin reductase family protein [Deltaproteobacteria bacterium]
GIEEQKTFSVNIPSTDLVDKVDYCGIYSGRREDKSEVFTVFFGALETAPLVEECPVNLECRLTHSLEVGTHNLIVGEIIETHATESCLADKTVDIHKVDPLIYIAGSQNYHRLGDPVGKAFSVGKKK